MKVVFIWIQGLERVSLVYSALVELNFTILHHNSLVVKRLTILNIITQFFFLVQVCRTREIASRAEQQTKATRRGQAKAQVRDDFTLIKHCRLLTLHWLQQHRLALQSYFDRRGKYWIHFAHYHFVTDLQYTCIQVLCKSEKLRLQIEIFVSFKLVHGAKYCACFPMFVTRGSREPRFE